MGMTRLSWCKTANSTNITSESFVCVSRVTAQLMPSCQRPFYCERLFYQRLRSISPFQVGNESWKKEKVAPSYGDKKFKVEWNFLQDRNWKYESKNFTILIYDQRFLCMFRSALLLHLVNQVELLNFCYITHAFPYGNKERTVSSS